MTFEFTYELTDELMRAATRRWLLHHTGWRVPIALVVLLLLLIPICGSDDSGYVCGFAAGALVLLAALVAVAYVTRNYRALSTARKLATRTARCTITDDGITVENALATSQIKWPLLDKVVRAPDVWLFFLSRQQYFALPADKLTPEARAFIERKVARVR